MRTKQYQSGFSRQEIIGIVNNILTSSLCIHNKDRQINESIIQLNNQFINFLKEISSQDQTAPLINFVSSLSKCIQSNNFSRSKFDNYKGRLYPSRQEEKRFSNIMPKKGNYKEYFESKYQNSIDFQESDSSSISFFKIIVNQNTDQLNYVLLNERIDPNHANDIMLFVALDALNCEDYGLFKFTLDHMIGRDLSKAFRLSIFDHICPEIKILNLFLPISKDQLNFHHKDLLIDQVLVNEAAVVQIDILNEPGFHSPRLSSPLLHNSLINNLCFDYNNKQNYKSLKNINLFANFSNDDFSQLLEKLEDCYSQYQRAFDTKSKSLSNLISRIKNLQEMGIAADSIDNEHKRVKFEKTLSQDMIYLTNHWIKCSKIAYNWHQNMAVCKTIDDSASILPQEIWQYIGKHLAEIIAREAYWSYAPKTGLLENSLKEIDSNDSLLALINAGDMLSDDSTDYYDYTYESTEPSSDSDISMTNIEEEELNIQIAGEYVDVTGF